MTTDSAIGCRARQRGFTLAESLMALTVLGIAAAGVLLPFTSGARVRAAGNRRTLGAKLASDLMEEIVDTSFDQIVTLYNYSEPQGQVRDAGGQIFADSNYADFSRDVSCEYVYVPQENGAGDANFVRATVRVYHKGMLIATINRLVSK
ncbi:MAG: type IV pilus modification PilV family protein [Planctomycetota bacterium]|jgi:prepilin-type N-terminal cleavage/methylation domain-containing protein